MRLSRMSAAGRIALTHSSWSALSGELQAAVPRRVGPEATAGAGAGGDAGAGFVAGGIAMGLTGSGCTGGGVMVVFGAGKVLFPVGGVAGGAEDCDAVGEGMVTKFPEPAVSRSA